MPQYTTKELIIINQPSRNIIGQGIFIFTDYYSIFHYGRMPDQIRNKGESICRMTCLNFELLEKAGIPTHFIKPIYPDKMEFHLYRILDPGKGHIRKGEINYFIPLQIVFRNSLPNGSSFLKRLKRGEINLLDYGLSSVHPGIKLPDPIIEFTTKLENVDRFIPEEYAIKISGLDTRKMRKLKEITFETNKLITKKAKDIGLDHADGKIEFAIDPNGSLEIVDSVGTPDENRFMYRGVHVGKQILRDIYAKKRLDTSINEWVKQKKNREEWAIPDSIPSRQITLVSNMYKSLCEAWINKTVWGGPSLDEIIKSLRGDSSEAYVT